MHIPTLGPLCVRRTIGKGGFGFLVHATTRQGRSKTHSAVEPGDIAVKLAPRHDVRAVAPGKKKPRRPRNYLLMLRKEVYLQTRVHDHPHIARVRSLVFSQGPWLGFAQELCPGMDVGSILQCGGPGGTPHTLHERQTRVIIRAVAAALGHMHACGIVHRDISLGNVVVDCGPSTRASDVRSVKLVDFGLAGQLPKDGSLLTRVCGTRAFLSPEMNAREGYNAGVDVWALGVLAYTLLWWEYPVQGNIKDHATLAKEHRNIPRRLAVWENCGYTSTTALHFVRCCLVHSAEERPSIAWLLKHHPWMKEDPTTSDEEEEESDDEAAWSWDSSFTNHDDDDDGDWPRDAAGVDGR